MQKLLLRQLMIKYMPMLFSWTAVVGTYGLVMPPVATYGLLETQSSFFQNWITESYNGSVTNQIDNLIQNQI